MDLWILDWIFTAHRFIEGITQGNTQTETHGHTHMDTQKHTDTHRWTHRHTRTRIHTRTRTHAHTLVHTERNTWTIIYQSSGVVKVGNCIEDGCTHNTLINTHNHKNRNSFLSTVHEWHRATPRCKPPYHYGT